MSPNSKSTDEYSIKNLAHLRDWVQNHPELFRSGNLLLLSGGMGAGKTTLVSLIVEELGGSSIQVSSPTFSLHHVYQVGGFKVDHMDLYRLQSDDDLTSSGFHEIVESEENLAIIEWAQRIDESFFQGLRETVYWIEITPGNGSERYLSVRKL